MTVPMVDLAPFFQTLEDLPCPLDWNAYFEQSQPVELDIGCGRGMFLVNSVDSRPEVNFCGVEIDYTEGRRGAKRLQKRAAPNGRVVGGDALVFLKKYVPAHSVTVAHVLFPDPWWKRKHRKRRLFTLEFIDLLARVLRIEDGTLHVCTDVEEYFGVITTMMDADQRFVREAISPLPEAQHDLDYLTSFHRRRTQAGAATYRALWRLAAPTADAAVSE